MPEATRMVETEDAGFPDRLEQASVAHGAADLRGQVLSVELLPVPPPLVIRRERRLIAFEKRTLTDITASVSRNIRAALPLMLASCLR